MSLFYSLAVSLSHVHMRARTHGSSSAHTLVHPRQPAGARVSVVCNPPPGLIPLNRPHPRVVGAASAILVPPTPHAQVLHPSRGFDTRTMAHVYTRTRMSRTRQHEDSIVSVNARVCARSRVERCSKSRWKLEGRSRRWKVAVRIGGRETGGEGKDELISESNARGGEEEEEVVEEEEEEKEVSFRGTSRVGNRLNFCHPLRHISLLSHLPPSPLSSTPLHPLVSPRRRLPYPRARSLHVPRPVRGNFFLVELFERDSKDSRVC